MPQPAIAAGSKGQRRYARAWSVINRNPGTAWRRWLLVRKSLGEPEEPADYIAAGRSRSPLSRLAVTAGTRWSIEGGFESTKQEAGLADSEVRSWTGWYWYMTLCRLAQAVLAAVRKLADGPPGKESPDEPELTASTVPEPRRPPWSRRPEPVEVLGLSECRRVHQAFARRCHYAIIS